MVLSQKIHDAFKGTVERMTSPRTVSAFKEKGVLSINEFIIAGDNLVSKCPTWSWYFSNSFLQSVSVVHFYPNRHSVVFAYSYGDSYGCIVLVHIVIFRFRFPDFGQKFVYYMRI